jgi:hypothetical protein
LKKFDYKERVIELIMPSKYDPHRNGRNSPVFDTTVLSQPENRRNYVTFLLDSNHRLNRERIKLFNDNVCKLISTRDTINGIHLQFEAGLKYGEFIEIINICSFKDTVNHFIVYGDNLWYLYKNVSTQRKIEIMNRRKDRIKEQNDSEEKQMMERTIELSSEPISKRLIEILKVWPCLIVLLLLGLISIRSMIKNNYR